MSQSNQKINFVKDEVIEVCRGEVALCHKYEALCMENDALSKEV